MNHKVFFLLILLPFFLLSTAKETRKEGVKSDDAEALKKRQEEIQKQKEEQKKTISSLTEAIRKKVKEMSVKEAQLEKKKKDLRALQQKLRRLEIQSNYLWAEMKRTEDHLDSLSYAARERILLIYKEGSKPYWAYLMESDSHVDFIDRLYYSSLLMGHDIRMLDALRTTNTRLKALKTRYEEKTKEVEELTAVVTREKNILDAELRKLMSDKKELLHSKTAAEHALDELEQEDLEITRQLQELKEQGGDRDLVFTGRFRLPLNGRLSSGFGMRLHPIARRRKMHTGIDIVAPEGTPIHATAPGRVFFADIKGGYGNCVIIVHGYHNNQSFSTLYAHLTDILVSTGDMVEAGEIIGTVGSTGYSTGPHLHFEIRVDGTPVNPKPYLNLR